MRVTGYAEGGPASLIVKGHPWVVRWIETFKTKSLVGTYALAAEQRSYRTARLLSGTLHTRKSSLVRTWTRFTVNKELNLVRHDTSKEI